MHVPIKQQPLLLCPGPAHQTNYSFKMLTTQDATFIVMMLNLFTTRTRPCTAAFAKYLHSWQTEGKYNNYKLNYNPMSTLFREHAFCAESQLSMGKGQDV